MYGTISSAYLKMTMPDGRVPVGHYMAHMVNPKNPSPETLRAAWEMMVAIYRAEGAARPLTFDFSAGVLRIVPNRDISHVKMKPHPSLKPKPFVF